MNDSNSFGRYLRRARKSRRYTLKQVGQAIGCSPQHIHDLESGNRGKRINPIRCVNLAEFLNIPLSTLLEKTGIEQDLSSKKYLEYLKLTRNKGRASRIQHAMDGIVSIADRLLSEANVEVWVRDECQKMKDFIKELDAAISAG